MRDTIEAIGFAAIVAGVIGVALTLFVKSRLNLDENGPWVTGGLMFFGALLFAGFIVGVSAQALGPKEGDTCSPANEPPPGFECRRP